MQAYDFSKWVCRCSCLGLLCTQPREKAAKERGDLSETAKTFLRKEYARLKYSRWKDIDSKFLSKGVLNEDEGISMLSFVDNVIYKKNDVQLQNAFFSGMPDIFIGPETILKADEIWDHKAAWDMDTFLDNVDDGFNPHYKFQLNGYFSLTTAKRGGIGVTLSSCPDHLIQDELYRLTRKMNVIDPDKDPKFIYESARIQYNMTFDDLSISERVLKFPVERDDDLITIMENTVIKGREFLTEFQDRHMNFNKIAA